MTDRYVDYDGFADVYNRHWGGFAGRVIDPLCRLGLDQLVRATVSSTFAVVPDN